MKRLFILMAVIVTAACEGAGPPPASTSRAAVSGSAETPAGSIQAGLRWATQAGGSGMSLTLYEADDDALLRLACVRDRSEMIVTGETFTAIGSEERLTLGVGQEAHLFVADPTAKRPSGVEARGPIPAALLAQLESASEISAVYGAQRIGPHIPPDPETARGFVSACRRLSAGQGGAAS